MKNVENLGSYTTCTIVAIIFATHMDEDDTCGRVLQPRWRTGSPWLLDQCDEEAGREEQSSPEAAAQYTDHPENICERSHYRCTSELQQGTVMLFKASRWFPHRCSAWGWSVCCGCKINCGCKKNWAEASYVVFVKWSKATCHKHCLSNLPVTRVTTLQLKQPTCFLSD